MAVRNIFTYGQTGDALDGFRDSEIAGQSAKKLLNWIISGMGTLRVAKQYDSHTIDCDTVIQKFLDTRYSFYVVVTLNHIVTYRKETNQKISALEHKSKVSYTTNINVFNDFISVVDDNGKTSVFAFNLEGLLGTTNFLDTVELPFLKTTELQADYYKTFEPTIGTEKQLRPELMRTYNGDLDVDVRDGKLYLTNLDVPIQRIYKQYKAGLDKSSIDGCAINQTYLLVRNYKKPDAENNYYAGNTPITFTGETADNSFGSAYFTGASPNGAKGTLRFGSLEDFKAGITDILEYQSRLIISTKEKLYFSKVLDYNNFVPGTANDEGFFLKLSPIDGNQPFVLKMSSGNGIFITSEKGIVVVGADITLTPASSLGSVFIAGNSSPTKISAMIESDFYYIDLGGSLRCITTKYSGGRSTYINDAAEKYLYERNTIKWLTRGSINEQNVCICTMKDTNEIKIYSKLDGNIFRNFSLEFDTSHPVFGFNNRLVSNKEIYTPSLKNYKKTKIINNLPYISSKSKGLYLMDFEMDYTRTVLSVFAPDDSLKGVKLNGIPFQNLQYIKGNYNIFDYSGTLPIIDLTVDMDTNETDDTIELKGINYSMRGGGM